jgi:hypothetical protein
MFGRNDGRIGDSPVVFLVFQIAIQETRPDNVGGGVAAKHL